MLTFKIEPDGDEFHAWVPELSGCHTHFRTVAEAMENLKEASELYLEITIGESEIQFTTFAISELERRFPRN